LLVLENRLIYIFTIERILRNKKNRLEVQEILTKLIKSNFLQTILKFVKLSNLFVKYRQRNKRITKINIKRKLKNKIKISLHNI